MKKILLYFISFVFIINNIFCINSYATEESESNAQQEINENVIVNDSEQPQESQQNQKIEEFCDAEVKYIGEIRDSEENQKIKMQEVTLEILEGTYKGKEVIATYNISNKEMYEKLKLEVGDEVYVIINGDVQGNLFVSIQGLHRNTYIWIILLIFFISIIFLYEKHSIKPIVSCIFLFLSIYFILFKLVSIGFNTILTMVLFLIIFVILESIINNGFNKKIWISLLGSFSGVLCSIIILFIFANLARIDIDIESPIISNMNYDHLMFVGAIISSIGVCLNLSIYIIQCLDKKKIQTKDFFRKDLFKLGVIYGKQEAIKFVNTIILVFVGVNFELIVVNCESYNNILNSLSQDYIFAGIISTISACVGVMVSVTMTSIFYALINSKKTIYKTTSANKIDGKRSLKI